MSSLREVLIRILALVQRKTLIKPKKSHIKMLALFFRPHPGGFDSSRVPTPGNLPSKAKKMLMPGGQPGGGLGAGGIDWCITAAYWRSKQWQTSPGQSKTFSLIPGLRNLSFHELHLLRTRTISPLLAFTNLSLTDGRRCKNSTLHEARQVNKWCHRNAQYIIQPCPRVALRISETFNIRSLFVFRKHKIPVARNLKTKSTKLEQKIQKKTVSFKNSFSFRVSGFCTKGFSGCTNAENGVWSL